MSTDWNIRCKDCNSVHTFSDANHQDELMGSIIEHAGAIASLAPLLKAQPDITLHTYWGDIDASWFLEHRGHRLVPHNEYGCDLGQCYKRVYCSSCNGSSRPCQLALDHEGPCDATPPVR